jgi:hypothetical protein
MVCLKIMQSISDGASAFAACSAVVGYAESGPRDGLRLAVSKNMRRKPSRGAGFWNVSGGPGSFAPRGENANLWERQNPHPAHPTTVRLQAAARGDGRDCGTGFGVGDKFCHPMWQSTPSPLRGLEPAEGKIAPVERS